MYIIMTLLNNTITWYGMRSGVYTVAESTICTIHVLETRFKHCLVMSHPLYLRISKKLHVSCNDGCPNFSVEGSIKLLNMALIVLT